MFFYFFYSRIFWQAAGICNAIRPLLASLRSREKTLCRCLILTGFFGCKYALFMRWISDISKWGTWKNRSKKKSFFNFYSPIVSQQGVLFRKTFRTMVLSLRSNEYILVQNLTRPPLVCAFKFRLSILIIDLEKKTCFWKKIRFNYWPPESVFINCIPVCWLYKPKSLTWLYLGS